jgi:ribokinase
MKILVYGSLNIDLTFSVDHIARPGETISSSSLVRGAGGKGANQAAALAKAGMEVYLAGKIGADGRFLLNLLQSYGVNTRYVSEYEGATGQALIQLDQNRQNAIVLYAGGNEKITKEEIFEVLANFTTGDCILLQNEINGTSEIMEAAGRRGLRIHLNPSPYNKNIESLPLGLTDALFVNEIEGAALAELLQGAPLPQILDRLALRFPQTEVVLTAGKLGAYYGFEGIREKGSIVDLPVVDTVGAGDTFTGYFIAARAGGISVRQSLALACKAASIAVSRAGAMESIPFAPEVFGGGYEDPAGH